MDILAYPKQHPWITGAVVIIGGILFFSIAGGGGAKAQANSSGMSDAEIAAQAQIEAAKVQANAAAGNAAAKVQLAQIGQATQMHHDDLVAQTTMRGYEIQESLGLANISANKDTALAQFNAQLEAQKSNNAAAVAIEQERGHVQVAMNSSNNKGSTAKGLFGTIGGIIGSIFSDANLKENIVKVGVAPEGYGIYEFNYKGSTTRRRGVIAQDVARFRPDAVTRSRGGPLRVNMETLSHAN